MLLEEVWLGLVLQSIILDNGDIKEHRPELSESEYNPHIRLELADRYSNDSFVYDIFCLFLRFLFFNSIAVIALSNNVFVIIAL